MRGVRDEAGAVAVPDVRRRVVREVRERTLEGARASVGGAVRRDAELGRSVGVVPRVRELRGPGELGGFAGVRRGGGASQIWRPGRRGGGLGLDDGRGRAARWTVKMR